jgi:hypothetical protein
MIRNGQVGIQSKIAFGFFEAQPQDQYYDATPRSTDNSAGRAPLDVKKAERNAR